MAKDIVEGFTEETPAKAAPAKLAPPSNARITPQPAKRKPAPKMPPPVPREGTVERHMHDRGVEGNPVPNWKQAAAKAMNGWPVGAEISRKDYDEAITQAENIRVQ